MDIRREDIPISARLERVRRGLRQSDVAATANVSQADVSALERGCYVPPARRRRILDALGLTEGGV